MSEQPPEAAPAAAAYCPACGKLTLHLVSDTMICASRACGYEHLLTRPIPIIQPAEPAPQFVDCRHYYKHDDGTCKLCAEAAE